MQERNSLNDGIDNIVVPPVRECGELGLHFTPYKSAQCKLDVHTIEQILYQYGALYFILGRGHFENARHFASQDLDGGNAIGLCLEQHRRFVAIAFSKFADFLYKAGHVGAHIYYVEDIVIDAICPNNSDCIIIAVYIGFKRGIHTDNYAQ